MKKLISFSVFFSLLFLFYCQAYAEVPQMINYQGKLTNASGAPVNDTIQMVFSIYADSTSASPLWTETQTSVIVEKGVFNVLLGSANPIPDSVFNGSIRYLGVIVGDDPEITPRKTMVSVSYAYKSFKADTAGYAHVGDDDWKFRVTDGGDTTLITGGTWGIARHANALLGNADSTHVNLGLVCTTGTDGENIKYCTVGGGLRNIASGFSATVGGGRFNLASTEAATVAGGRYNSARQGLATVGGGGSNIASGNNATVAGGYTNLAGGNQSTIGGGVYNTANGEDGTVGGGSSNTASGMDATVPGGSYNTAAGDNSFASGYRAKANHSGTFVWSDRLGSDFTSTANNQFLIRAAGGVGIGTTSPAYQLDVVGTTQVTSFKMPTGASSGYVLTSDASGVGTWQGVRDTVNFAKRADTANVALNSLFGQVYQDASLDSTDNTYYTDLKTHIIPAGTFSTGFFVFVVGYFIDPTGGYDIGGLLNIVINSTKKIENGGYTTVHGLAGLTVRFQIPISVMYYVDKNDPDWNPLEDVTVRIQGKTNHDGYDWVYCRNVMIFGQ